MRLTRHNGRAGKNGVYNPKHNDRKFNVKNSYHIDAEKTKYNIYWDYCRGFSSPAIKRDEAGNDITFREIELAYYFEHYQEHIDAQNGRNEKSRHTERNRTVEDLLKNRKTCPEETVYQIGNMDETVPAQVLLEVCTEYFALLEKKFGSHFHILDWALHLDEATPHIQERHVFDCKNNYGELCPQQEKALEEMGIPLPEPDQKKSKTNNRKITFDARCRELLFEVCGKHGLQLETMPVYGGREYLEKQDFVIAKQKEVIGRQEDIIRKQETEIEEKHAEIKDTDLKLQETAMKLSDIETVAEEVAQTAYERACEVVADTVRNEIKKEDIGIIEKHKGWLSSSERTADGKLREYAVRHLDKVIEKIRFTMKDIGTRLTKRLQEPERRADNIEQVKKAARESLKKKLGGKIKETEIYKAGHYGVKAPPKRSKERSI